MATFSAQLPWIVVWVVVLLWQERFIRQKKWLGSLILIWFSLVLSFVWDPLMNLIREGTVELGSRFWLLFVITAILHVLGRRREKKESKELPAQASDPTEE